MNENAEYPVSNPPRDSVVWRIFNLQPAAWRGVVTAVFVVLAAVGIKVSSEIPDAVFLAVLAILPIAQAIWTKGAVTPNAKVVVVQPDPVSRPQQVQAGEAVVPSIVSDERILDAARSEGV